MQDAKNIGWLGDESVTTIEVEGVSKRGKQIVKEYGSRWWLCRIDEHLACFNDEGGVLIAPAGHHWHSATSRWVKATNWLVWSDDDLRLTAETILKLADMPLYEPSGS